MEDGLDYDITFNDMPKYPWRPSYKQMEALNWAIKQLQSYNQIVGYLEDLFNELKEL